MLEAEFHSRPYCRGWTSFAATLDDCERMIGALGRSLGFPWLCEMERIGVDLRASVRPEARHWVEARQERTRRDLPFLQSVWDATRRAASGDEATSRALFDESRALLAEFDRYHEHYERRLDAIHASTCWRLTAPLRFVKRAMREAMPGASRSA